ncbi:TIGR04086 family membrane protein [Sporolactobacillus sp. Y61]|uniref:TIGR04086 family membrane protein n=1 Tax=Sporolactobacillus sp. Y61 TaxID=3160863 RepID=A0AAU8IF31_9BACL|nr:TIGR04086 family membrane protein [Sporolactobacillus sp. THM19-2]RYL94705.1 TIGR04086 family membrane protein [Sporolactobacillus sp. THM19-2]
MARNWLSAVTYGIATSIIIVLASAFLLASLLRFTSFAETSGTVLPVVISITALFIGGVISGSKLKERGLLIGAVTGLFYCLFSLFFQYLGLDHWPGLMQYVYFLANIASAAIGGIVGVNLFSGRHHY